MSSPKLNVANYLCENFTLKELEDISIDVLVNHFQYSKGTVGQGLKLAKRTIKHNQEVEV